MTRPDTQLKRALSAIDAAIVAIDLELSAPTPTPGVPGDDVVDCRKSLEAMGAQLLSGEGGTPLPGYGYVIIDSWPRNTAVGSAILKAEIEYEAAWKAFASKR